MNKPVPFYLDSFVKIKKYCTFIPNNLLVFLTVPLSIVKPHLPGLNFPTYAFRMKHGESTGYTIFDPCRKKFVPLSPEEWVRQHLIRFLHEEKGFPLSLMAVERSLKLNTTLKRTDVLVYNNKLSPLLIAECKAPSVELSQQVLDQALRYNLVFGVRYIILTNGIRHFSCLYNESGETELLSDFPMYMKL